MEQNGLQCHGCGSSNVTFDPKSRMLVCHQCGNSEYYSRSTLNANGKVVYSKQNAMNFFADGKFDNAYHYSMEVLNISQDNAPALYMMAYYDEYVVRRAGAIKKFFDNITEIALEYQEVRDLKDLFLESARSLLDFEQQVLTLMAINMKSEEDKQELNEFIDKISPYFIKRRTSSEFLNGEMVDIYAELAEHCGIPKTCYALIKGIDENPDSPYIDDSFYLHSKAKYFYEHYIVALEKIINSMNNNEYNEKFMSVYKKKKQKYEQDANL